MPHKASLFQSFLDGLAVFPVGSDDRIVVAVSGGPDSVCLLHLFRKWAAGLEKPVSGNMGDPLNRLHVAHLNHGFRVEADDEAAFVAHLCQSWGIAHTVEKRPVAAICKEKHLSKQEGARIVRYAFLKEVAERQKARFIALGHTADDCAETFLINLIRGAGGEGLSGIPPMREETIMRPMLSITRDDIMRELADQQIPYREDPSNRDKRFLRNRVRHDLMPILSAINPHVKTTLIRTATLLADENRFFQAQIEPLASRLFRLTANEVVCDLSRFQALHKAVKRRLIRWAIVYLHGSTNGITFDHIEAILQVVSGQSAVSLPHGLWAKRRGDTLCLTRSIFANPLDFAPFELPRDLFFSPHFLGSVTLDIPSWKMRLLLEKITNWGAMPKEADIAWLDYDKIPFPLTLRSWRPGDLFMPLGMRGRHKKLQDFFVDRKISREARHQIPLFVGAGKILWIIGHTIDERYRVTETTKTILVVKVEKER